MMFNNPPIIFIHISLRKLSIPIFLNGKSSNGFPRLFPVFSFDTKKRTGLIGCREFPDGLMSDVVQISDGYKLYTLLALKSFKAGRFMVSLIRT